MAQRRLKTDQFQSENVYPLPQATSVPDGSSEALDLVYKAADMFRELEERAHDTEARAHAMCRAASEQVRQAQIGAEGAARADPRRGKASSALEQAEARIRAQADKLTAAEYRAQSAEAETRQAQRALAL